MRWTRLAFLVPAAALSLALGAPSAEAQTLDELRRQYLIPVPNTLVPILSERARSSPGSSSGSPGAYGAGWGDFFVGGGLQARTRYAPSDRDGVDGSLVFGFGLGNARDLIGLEVALTSLSTFDSGFFQRSALGLKAHRILPGNVGVGVGVENIMLNGDTDTDQSYYGVVSKVWDPSGWSPLLSTTTSIGIGNGRFRSEEDFNNDTGSVNLFASVGVQVFEPVSVIADWTGQDLTLAASIVPFRAVPLVITPGFADVTGSAGDGARFILGFGMGMNISQIPGQLFPR